MTTLDGSSNSNSTPIANPSPSPVPIPLLTPSPLPPEEFERELRALVQDLAPRVFAVVQEYRRGSEDEDGWVVAWGLVCEDGSTHVTSVNGVRRFTARTPEAAVSRFGLGGADVSARLMWVGRAA